MLELKQVTIEDKGWVEEILKRHPHRGSEYTFSNLINWSSVYNIKIAEVDGWLIMKSGYQNGAFAFPAGFGDVSNALDAMKDYCTETGVPLILYSVNSESKKLLEKNFRNRFTFTPTRDNFDYIYSRENLATLKGNKYHSKRNHIARFKDHYPGWTYEPLTPKNIVEAIQMNSEWCIVNKCEESHSLKREACAVKIAFTNYFQLGLTGGLIRAEGKVVAFTFGSAVTEDTFVIHVEKAFTEIQGAYPIINQEFVLNELSGYQYVNREDDLGNLGLRMAKESYRPEFMYERFVAKEEAPC